MVGSETLSHSQNWKGTVVLYRGLKRKVNVSGRSHAYPRVVNRSAGNLFFPVLQQRAPD